MTITERLAECRWPALNAPFDAALREAIAFVFDTFNPVGIIATGTIVRGTAHATSDLDICVVHDAAFRQRVQRFFNGVPAEIFVNPPHTIRAYFQDEHADARPIFAHMLATGMVVWSAGSITDELRREAESWLARTDDVSSDWLTRRRYSVASQLEDAFDMIVSDQTTARLLLGQAVAAMIEFECRKRTGRVARGKDVVRVVTAADGETGILITAFFSATAIDDQRAAAVALADRVLGARGFFEWDSGPEAVDPG